MNITSSIPPSGPFALFVRHGPRHEIPKGDPYADVDLTPAGEALVTQLGALIGPRLAWGASSPFLRCVRTARLVGVEPELDSRLGQDGPWVVDPTAAGALFAARGTEDVVRAQIAGERLEGFRPAPEGLALLLSTARDRLSAGAGICVSHDAVLMPAIAALFGPDATEGWLDPLDGFVLLPRGAGLIARWGDRERPC